MVGTLNHLFLLSWTRCLLKDAYVSVSFASFYSNVLFPKSPSVTNLLVIILSVTVISLPYLTFFKKKKKSVLFNCLSLLWNVKHHYGRDLSVLIYSVFLVSKKKKMIVREQALKCLLYKWMDVQMHAFHAQIFGKYFTFEILFNPHSFPMSLF